MSDPDNNKSQYTVLARKYRPQNFDDLIGQQPMVQTLSNAFETGRIAQAYMLTGVRGVGKTTTARILARALPYETANIDKPTVNVREPGEHCQAIMEGRHVDIIEMDAASHTGIDDVRDLIESAQYKPTSARHKVYIIDEVHMLSKNAFNGLLKTLEEPPEHLKFIFATTEIRKVPVTVLSRCQRFDLRRIQSGEMTDHLEKICKLEKVDVDVDALALIARASEGSVRDALSMLDQAISHGAIENNNKVDVKSVRIMLGLADRARIIDLFEHVMSGDIAAALAELKSQYNVGAEPLVVLTDLADFIHFVTKLKYVKEAGEDRSLSETERSKGMEFAEKLTVRVLGRAWQILLKGIAEVQASERPLQSADMVLIRITHAADLPTPDDLIRKIQDDAQPSAHSASDTSGLSQPSARNEPVTATGSSGTIQNTTLNTMSAPATQSANPPAPRLVAGSGISASVPEYDPQSPQQTVPEKFRTVSSFEELIFLVEDKRDLSLKTFLRRNVRPVSFDDGKIEFNLVNNPPKNFLPDLSQKLHEWTGKRWMIATSQKEGSPTLEELEMAEDSARVAQARNDPTVEAILSRFPGSKIIDVRIKQEDVSQLEAQHDSDESDGDGLDDFFE